MTPIKLELEEIILEKISKFYPIRLNQLNSVIVRIQEQYPFLSKTDINNIIISFFQILRTELFRGKLIDFKGHFPGMALLSYSHNKFKALKIKIKTPGKIK